MESGMTIDMKSSRSCVGCVYWEPITVISKQPKPCNFCSRNYRDRYTSTSVTTHAEYLGDNNERK